MYVIQGKIEIAKLEKIKSGKWGKREKEKENRGERKPKGTGIVR